jgi:hypothetical protein
MPTVGEGKENHQVNFTKQGWRKLNVFKIHNKFPDNGAAIEALLDNFKKTLDMQQQLDEGTFKAEALLKELEEREEILSEREARVTALEQECQQGSGVSQQTFSIVQDLIIEHPGITEQDIFTTSELIKKAGTPVSELNEQLAKLGTIHNYILTLRATVSKLEGDKVAIEDTKMGLAMAAAKLKKDIEELEQERDRMAGEAENAMVFAESVTAAYASLGIIMDNIVGRMLAGGRTIADLPEMGVRLLAGTILTICVGLYGDRSLDMAYNIDAGRLVNVKVLLSELPGILAPKEFYDELKRRLTRQGGIAEMSMGGSGQVSIPAGQ